MENIERRTDHPANWTPQELINYILEEGILTENHLMALAPTDDQLLSLVIQDEIEKE